MKTSVFVMTDVVGSTALWETHGDAMAASLQQHDRVVAGALTASGGRVFKHTGDGMLAVFDDADAAAIAGLDAVTGLAAAAWGETGPLEIRVSIHAGPAAERDGDFFGPPLNKTARINGIGHGGQVLTSDVARQLMRTPIGVDLGEHQLRDLSEPIRVWQLDAGDHPPLRTLVTSRHNLPVMPTEFIGRLAEVDELRNLVRDNRLVTITGVGGCGKTRIAIEVAAACADSFAGGVWFVDLTAERDPSAVGTRALGAMGLTVPLSDDYSDATDALVDAVQAEATLLVIDNCEHLIDEVAELAEHLLADAPLATVLATSREALAVDGERVWRIPNLEDAAIELFLDRAAAVGVTNLADDLDTIERVCAALDHIPLAIELAASQVASLSLEEVARRLDDRFALLGGGRRSGRRRQRQHTLQSMMDWSHGLLTDDEQLLLAELSVFTGSFPVEGVEAVATPTRTPVVARLQSLVQQSLVVPLRDTGRYRLLETVRLYALDKLAERGDVADTRNRHLTWVSGAFGPKVMVRLHDSETPAYEHRAWAEIENAIAAMEWADETGDADALFGVFIGFGPVWQNDSRYSRTGLSWLERVPQPPPSDPLARAMWLTTAGLLRFNLGDLATAIDLFLEGASHVDELRDHDPAYARLWSPVIHFRANVHASLGDHDAALADADLLIEIADRIPGRDAFMRWMSHMARRIVHVLRREPSLEAAAQALDAIRGTSPWAEAIATAGCADAALDLGQYEDALVHARACLEAPAVNEGVRAGTIHTGAAAAAALGRFDDAFHILETDLGPMLDGQRRLVLGARLGGLAAVLAALGEPERITELAGVALHLGGASVYDQLIRIRWIGVLGDEQVVDTLREPPAWELDLDRVAQLCEQTMAEARTLAAGVC